MTIATYISRVREKLSDNVQPYRISTVEITDALKEALIRAKSVRPSLRYADGVLVHDEQDITFAENSATTVRSELDRYAEGLVFLAAGRALANDNADTLNIAVSEKWKAAGLEILAI